MECNILSQLAVLRFMVEHGAFLLTSFGSPETSLEIRISNVVIRRSDSQWSSPLHMVPKSDGSWRPCGDFRRLNDVTTPDRYPIPHIQDFTANLSGSTIFSKIDLIKLIVYLDDILVASHSKQEHLILLLLIFGRLQHSGLAINLAKCEFGKPELNFLRHKITRHGVSPLPEKVEAINRF